MSGDNTHKWRFFRAGGFDQVRLDTGADIVSLGQLDQKLWVSLSCPVHGLEFDTKTLELIDTDGDGRIRVPEILAAAKWAGALLKDPDDLTKASPEIRLDAVNDTTDEGRQILASCRQILADLGKPGTEVITLDDTADTARIFAQTRFNGDGIIPADAADDPAVRQVIEEIIACLGSETDRGKPGINEARMEQFFNEAQALSDWWKIAESDPATILPLGEATAAAHETFAALKGKIDDYFVRCRLAATPRPSPCSTVRRPTTRCWRRKTCHRPRRSWGCCTNGWGLGRWEGRD